MDDNRERNLFNRPTNEIPVVKIVRGALPLLLAVGRCYRSRQGITRTTMTTTVTPTDLHITTQTRGHREVSSPGAGGTGASSTRS